MAARSSLAWMTEATVQIFHNAQLVAAHVRKAAGKQNLSSHYQPEKVVFQVKTPDWCRAKPKTSGRPARRSSTRCWRSVRCFGYAPPRASWAGKRQLPTALIDCRTGAVVLRAHLGGHLYCRSV